jgi:hypothetical protein
LEPRETEELRAISGVVSPQLKIIPYKPIKTDTSSQIKSKNWKIKNRDKKSLKT